jgi:uncharacterized protein (DUF952 family)
LGVGAAWYADATAPRVVLVIDTELLDVPVVVENLECGDEGLPHIYGPLPTSAVVEVRRAEVIEGGFRVAEGRHAQLPFGSRSRSRSVPPESSDRRRSYA